MNYLSFIFEFSSYYFFPFFVFMWIDIQEEQLIVQNWVSCPVGKMLAVDSCQLGNIFFFKVY